MAWSHSYTARPEHWLADDRGVMFIGSHDGYARRGGDAIHRRLVWFRPEGYVIVYDEFECEREHEVELNFQFAPGDLCVIAPGLAAYQSAAPTHSDLLTDGNVRF